MDGELFRRAAMLYESLNIPHVCWAVGIADGFESRQFEQSPAVQWFQWNFANIPARDKLETYDMLADLDGDAEIVIREFSLTLLATAAEVVDDSEFNYPL